MMKTYIVVEECDGKVGVSNAFRSKIHAIVEMQEMFRAAIERNPNIENWVDVTDKQCTTPHLHFANGQGDKYMIRVITRTID